MLNIAFNDIPIKIKSLLCTRVQCSHVSFGSGLLFFRKLTSLPMSLLSVNNAGLPRKEVRYIYICSSLKLDRSPLTSATA